MALPKYQNGQQQQQQQQKGTQGAKAEPSSKKRAKPASPAAKVEPSKKRAKAEEIAAANAAAARCAAIEKALLEAQGLAPSVRRMLSASLVGFSSAGDCHAFQESVLRMLNQTLNGVEAAMMQQLHQTNNAALTTKQEFERKEHIYVEAEAALAQCNGRAQQVEATLAEGVITLKACKVVLDDTDKLIRTGDTSIGEKAMEIEQLLKLLSRVSEEKLSEQALQTVLHDLSIPSTSSNASRLVDSIGDSSELPNELQQRVASLREMVSRAANARAGHVARMKATEAQMSTATESQVKSKELLATVQAEKSECESAWKEAGRRYRQQKTLNAQSVKAMQVAHKKLTDFRQGALAAFKDMVREIERKNDTRILLENVNVVQVDQVKMPLTLDAEMSDVGVESKVGLFQEQSGTRLDLGTPVIDRTQRQAFLRRRSAQLPIGNFCRLSLIKRRNSMVGNQQKLDAVTAGECSKHTTFEGDEELARKDVPDTNGPTDVPTPSRSSIGCATA